jgi:preprotein translocase subunit SecY
MHHYGPARHVMNPLTSSGSDTCFVSHTWISDGLSCCIHSFTVSGGFWHQLRDMLNPSASGAQPWHYYTINAVLIFIFNILDIVDTPKEVTEYMMKTGARIPDIKPGRQTIEYLRKIQSSTRFWGEFSSLFSSQL